MRRIILVLAVAALMAVLMATSVSPAFAKAWWADGDGAPGQECKGKDTTAVKGDQNCGWHEGQK